MQHKDLFALLFVVFIVLGVMAANLGQSFSLEGRASYYGALLGSVFGFVAIITAAFVNADMNRRRDDRQRDLELLALFRSIKLELVDMQEKYETGMQFLNERYEGFDDPSLTEKPWIMPTLIATISRLVVNDFKQETYWLTSEHGLRLLGHVDDRLLVNALTKYAAQIRSTKSAADRLDRIAQVLEDEIASVNEWRAEMVPESMERTRKELDELKLRGSVVIIRVKVTQRLVDAQIAKLKTSL